MFKGLNVGENLRRMLPTPVQNYAGTKLHVDVRRGSRNMASSRDKQPTSVGHARCPCRWCLQAFSGAFEWVPAWKGWSGLSTDYHL